MSQQQRKPSRRKPPSQPAPDPLSVLVSASELRAWRQDDTTEKVLRYLAAWRGQLKEFIAEGNTLFGSCEASALKTTEAVAKAQILLDILELTPDAIASFYGLKTLVEEGQPEQKKK